MTNKIKSIIYLGCFIIAAVVYEQTDVAVEPDMMVNKSEMAEVHTTGNTYADDIE